MNCVGGSNVIIGITCNFGSGIFDAKDAPRSRPVAANVLKNPYIEKIVLLRNYRSTIQQFETIWK